MATIIILAHNRPLSVATPIVAAGGYLNPWQVALRQNKLRYAASAPAYLRQPMPWEDGYFDPTYHTWPKQSGGGGEKQQKIASSQTMTGGGGADGQSGA